MPHLHKGQPPSHYTGFQDFLFCKEKKNVLFLPFPPFPLCLGANPDSEANTTPSTLHLYFGSTGQDDRLWGYVSLQSSGPGMAKNGNQPNDQLLMSSLPSAEYWVTPRTGCSACLSPSPSKDDHYQSLDSYLFWRQVSPVAWISFNARQHFQEQVDFITATDPSTLLTSDVIPHCVARWNHNWASVAPIIMLIAYSGIIYRLMFCSATDGRAYSWHHKREQLSL